MSNPYGTLGNLYEQLTNPVGKDQTALDWRQAMQWDKQNQTAQSAYNQLSRSGYQQVGNELSRGNVKNSSSITTDPTYGDITPISNVEHKTTGLTNVIDTVSPYAINAIMGSMAGPVMGEILGTSSKLGSTVFNLGKNTLTSGASNVATIDDSSYSSTTQPSQTSYNLAYLFPDVFSGSSVSDAMETIQEDQEFNDIIDRSMSFLMPEFVYSGAL